MAVHRNFLLALLVSRLNSAPMLDDSSDLAMTINANDFDNAGLTVAQWLSTAGTDPITDADGDPEGIAIVGFTDSNGRWQVSIDGGTIWVSLRNVPVVNPKQRDCCRRRCKNSVRARRWIHWRFWIAPDFERGIKAMESPTEPSSLIRHRPAAPLHFQRLLKN